MTLKFYFAPLALILTIAAIAPSSSAQNLQGSTYQSLLRQVERNPSNPELSFRFAAEAVRIGDTQGAITALERILFLYPNLSNIKLELGVLYLRQGQTAIAERFIEDAIQDPAAPEEVVERSKELLAIAKEQQNPFEANFKITGGVFYDTNANFGPPGTNVGNFIIDPGAVEQSDTSYYGLFEADFYYDLGTQAGHRAALELSYFTRKYRELSEFDADRLFGAVGIDFNATRLFERPTEIALRYFRSNIDRDGESYLNAHGLEIGYKSFLSERTRLNLLGRYSDRDFIPTSSEPANDIRDSDLYTLSAEVQYALDEDSSVFGGATFASNDAAVDFESFQSVGLNLGYSRWIEGLFGIYEGDWRFTASTQVTWRDYDAADVEGFQTEPQEDRDYVIGLFAEFPVGDRYEIIAELSHFGTDSNFVLDEYDNTSVSLNFSARW